MNPELNPLNGDKFRWYYQAKSFLDGNSRLDELSRSQQMIPIDTRNCDDQKISVNQELILPREGSLKFSKKISFYQTILLAVQKSFRFAEENFDSEKIPIR